PGPARSQEQDASETLALLEDGGCDWLVVDHYGLDASWEKRLRARARRLLVIDDLANRAHDRDLLLDQNSHAHPRPRYEGLVPPGCRLLLGPRHALLRPEFESLPARQAHGSSARKVLVSLGGADPDNVTAKVLAALAGLPELEVDVIVGGANP